MINKNLLPKIVTIFSAILLVTGCLNSVGSKIPSSLNNSSQQNVCSITHSYPDHLYRIDDPSNLSSINYSAIPMRIDDYSLNKSEIISIALSDLKVQQYLKSGGEVMYIGSYNHPTGKNGPYNNNYIGLFTFFPNNCGGGEQIIFGIDPTERKVIEKVVSVY